jgi:hypothetical protein
MMVSNRKAERITIGLILCVALLTFFSSLVSLRVPVGDQLGDVYDVRAGLTLLRSSMGMFTTLGFSEDRGVSTRTVAETLRTPEPLDVPYSVRMASVPPWLIFAALACAGLALLDLLLVEKGTALISLVGGCFGGLAIVQLAAMSSDLRSWTERVMNSGALGSPNNPAMSTRVLMLNTFHVNPGAGLYLLTGCLFLVPVLSYSRAIPKVRSVVRHERRINVSQPIRVRPLNPHCSEEVCNSLDVSRNGLYLESASSDYYVGMEVYVTRDAQPGTTANPEEHGSVVRVEKQNGGKCRFAIRIIPQV